MSASGADSAPLAPGTRTGFAAHFVESVILTWMGNLLRIAIGLVALRLVTAAIVEAELGAYWVLTSVAGLLSNFADLGIGIGSVRHLSIEPDRERARRLIHTVLLLRLAVLVLLCALVLVCKPWVLRLFDAQVIGEKYYYVYVFIVVGSLGELYTNFLQGMNRFRAVAAFALFSSLARFVLILLLVRHWRGGVDGLFLAEAVAMAIAIGLSAWASAHGWRLRPRREEARRQLRFGFPLYLNTLLSYTVSRLNTVMIGSMSGTAAVGYFGVASRIPDQLSLVLRTFNFVYLPHMSRFLAQGDRVHARNLLAASLRLMSFSFALVALVLSFFRHEVLAVLAPPSYQTAAPAVPLLLGGLTFAALGSVMGSTIVALGDSRTPVKINFWTSVVGFALNWLCIQRWGLLGAAWASLLHLGIGYVITDLVLARRIRPENRSYLRILAYMAALAALGLGAGLAWRLALLALATGGSLLLSPALRQDLGRVWAAARVRRPGSLFAPAP